MAPSYSLFCMGNPLLDMQVTNGEELLKKYDLKANDAILAEEKQALEERLEEEQAEVEKMNQTSKSWLTNWMFKKAK